MDQSVSVIPWLAALAGGPSGVVEAAQTHARHGVAGGRVLRVGVVVAATLLTLGARQRQVSVETSRAALTAGSCGSRQKAFI